MRKSTDPMRLRFSLQDCTVEGAEQGVRIIHRASGAVGECREERQQSLNKRRAFERMTETKEFKSWHLLECARKLGNITIEDKVSAAMQPENLKVENY